MKKIILMSLFILLFGCQSIQLDNEYIPITRESKTSVSLVAVGDNLIHNPIYESSYKNGVYDFKPIYQEIKPYIKKHDIAFINQETILGGVELGLSSYPLFNSPYEVGV